MKSTLLRDDISIWIYAPIRILAFACMLLIEGVSLASAQTKFATDFKSRSRVLFISSYHANFPSFFKQLTGLQQVFQQYPVQLDIEFIDAKRIPSPLHFDHFFTLLEDKLDLLPEYDIVIVGDDIGVRELNRRRKLIFPDTPIVFLGVNDVQFARQLDRTIFTGVTETISLQETMLFIHSLYPKMPMVVISDNSLTGLNDLYSFLEIANEHEIPYEQIELSRVSFEELPEALRAYDEKTPILLISAYLDKNNISQDFFDSMQTIMENAKGPIFHMWEQGFGHGLLGGKILSQQKQGEIAAGKALEILQGKAVEDIPIQFDSANTWMFDFKVAQQYGLEEKDFPEGSIFINRKQMSGDQLWRIVFVFTLMLFGLSLIQFYFYQRRKKEQLKIKEQNLELEKIVEIRTRDLERAKADIENSLQARNLILDNSIVAIVLVIQNEINWCNSYCEYLFGYSEHELQNMHIQSILTGDESFQVLSKDVESQIKHQGAYIDEVQFKRKTGESFWGLVNAKSVSHNTFREGILFIVSDISRLKTIQFELEMLNEKLIHISQTDELTQVANRRSINEFLAREQSRLLRYQQNYCVILLDIDFFKRINDEFGHTTGDIVLKQVADLLKNELRSVDEVGRWGGEEFMVICPFTMSDQASHLAETLREKFKQKIIVNGNPITASFGVYQPVLDDTVQDVLEYSDKALYRAKEKRDTVFLISHE